jgi:hypothetical protein
VDVKYVSVATISLMVTLGGEYAKLPVPIIIHNLYVKGRVCIKMILGNEIILERKSRHSI